jgi:hypothetical protein
MLNAVHDYYQLGFVDFVDDSEVSSARGIQTFEQTDQRFSYPFRIFTYSTK